MKELFRTLLPYYRPYRRGMVIGLCLVVISNFFTIAGPYIIKEAIDAMTSGTDLGVIVRYAGLLVLVALIAGGIRWVMRELLNSISRRIETDLRNDLFAHLLRLPAEFYDRWRTGDLMSRATNDVLAVRQVAGPAIMYLVNTATISALAVGLMIWISPRLTLFAMIPMVLLPVAVLQFGKRIHTLFEGIQSQFSDISAFAQENLSGMRIVKAYGRGPHQAAAFGRLNREYMRRNMALARVWGAFFPTLGMLGGVGAVVVLWLGGREVIADRITLGDFVAFGFYLTLLMWPMIALGWVTNLFQRGSASMSRINELLTQPVILSDSAAPARPMEVAGAIEFDDVSFRYPGTERWVLQDISLQIEPGQTVAFVGATASGKSTLVHLIPRLYDATEGTVRIDGLDVQDIALSTLRGAVAMVPQETFLFSDSLRGNLMMGRHDADRTELNDPGVGIAEAGRMGLDEAIEIAQLGMTLDVLPEGLESRLGERGINLSGGQKQRATIARALFRDAPVLILDDSLSAVDTVTEEAILAGLQSVLSDRTSIIVSHRVSAVAGADRIFVLDDGRLTESGTHEELLALGGTYTRLLERQLLAEEIQDGAAVS